MSNDDLKPSRLYEKFSEHNPIAFKPIGFVNQTGVNPDGFYFTVDTEAAIVREGRSYFDVREAGFAFDFGFDPQAGGSPIAQMDALVWRTLRSGPLHYKKFFAVPSDMKSFFDCLDGESHDEIPVSLKCEGDPVRGLYLDTDLRVRSWDFFVPKGTRLNGIIEQARKLQREERMAKSGNGTSVSVGTEASRLAGLIATM